ncbi:MAG: AmmeMemoRadiSam system protein B [Balneolaceae bacterium]|nr:AmmeMemoRadiSam system protein B [Balneolaceae bacterium]
MTGVKKERLFNSFDKPIPPVRYDIQQIPIQQNGEEFIYFYDSLSYATGDFSLPADSQTVLSLLDGNRSIDDLITLSHGEVSKNDLLNYIRYLDENGILQSKFFKHLAKNIEIDYEQSAYHISNTAGISYPNSPTQLISYLNQAFELHEQSEPKEARALFAPHIDPRVGLSAFVKAFSAIRDLQPKKVFILATSHYSGMYNELYDDFPFIVSEKTFQLPNGSIDSNKDFRRMLSPKKWNKIGVSFQDRAHRVEHSIELHLLFLNHIWKHDFEIIPILIGGMDELLYSDESHKQAQMETFAAFLEETYGNDPEAFFLISGDLSHFGKKFGDQEAATSLLPNVEANDQLILSAGASGNPKHLIYAMRETFDKFRICGFPPLVTFLSAFPKLSGEILSYDLWDEQERESAVTFGSILFN